MSQYSDLISKLIEDESVPGSFVYISMYLPNENGNNTYFKKLVKSLLLSKIHENNILIDAGMIKDELTEKIDSEIDRIEDFKNGLVIFSKVKVENRHQKVVSTNVAVLLKPAVQDIFVDTAYDLDQLVWMENRISKELVVVLSEDKVKFYALEDDDLNLIKEEENQTVPEDDKESMNAFRTAGGIREKEDAGVISGLLSQTLKSLKTDLNKLPDFDYIAIIYSSSFNDQIKAFSDKLSKIFNKQDKCLLIDKNVSGYQEIKELVSEKINAAMESKKTESFNKIKEKDYKNFTDEWKEVLRCVRERRVEKLFVKPAIKKEGFLKDDGDVYSEPEGSGRKVRNIIPWLIKLVIQSSGEVIIFEKQEEGVPDIAAQLRF